MPGNAAWMACLVAKTVNSHVYTPSSVALIQIIRTEIIVRTNASAELRALFVALMIRLVVTIWLVLPATAWSAGALATLVATRAWPAKVIWFAIKRFVRFAVPRATLAVLSALLAVIRKSATLTVPNAATEHVFIAALTEKLPANLSRFARRRIYLIMIFAIIAAGQTSLVAMSYPVLTMTLTKNWN